MRWTASLALLVAFPLLSGCLSGANDAPAGDEGMPGDDPSPAAENETGPWTGDERAIGVKPIEIIFGGSLRHATTDVLLIPPTHGDLGNPLGGPPVTDYLDATLEGIRDWVRAIGEFVADHPEYGYLENISVRVEVFDGQAPQRAGYDVVVGYIETSGPAFRGVATQLPPDTQAMLNERGLGDTVRWSNRFILLSLFASAPRAGQDLPDFPERHEMKVVTMHEFAHTWGLGHSTTWTEVHGPDLMNSPYPLVYGDGNPVGDGGERSPDLCPSSLDLYGLAHLYRWLPNGTWAGSKGMLEAPMPYKVYCKE